MHPDRFRRTTSGRLVEITLHNSRVGLSGILEFDPVRSWAFLPNPLPPPLDWDAIKSNLFSELEAATAALAGVNGLVTHVPNTKVLLRTLWIREARLSSEIENIHTTAIDMALSEEGRLRRPTSSAAREAWNAMVAVQHALDSDLPFSTRLIREMHAKLLTGVRGEDKRPGELRNGPVYIGGSDAASARFVPPPATNLPGELLDCLAQLERFVNSPTSWPEIPRLVQIALAHYQFETIHPFRDGNGRIGRALILHHMCSLQLLDLPVVSISGALNTRRQDYVDGLFRVSADSDWIGWIRFFLVSLAAAAAQTRALCERLLHEHRQASERIRTKELPPRLLALLDHLYDQPIASARSVAAFLNVTDPTARKDIESLVKLDILRPLDDARYGRLWYAPTVFELADASDEELFPPQ